MISNQTENKKIAKETLDVLENGFTTSKRIHPGYSEYEDAKKKDKTNFFEKHEIKQHFGKWQYNFEKGDMKISLIKLRKISLTENKKKNEWFWEIHAFEDKRLFQDVKKFPTKEKAMDEVIRIMGD